MGRGGGLQTNQAVGKGGDESYCAHVIFWQGIKSNIVYAFLKSAADSLWVGLHMQVWLFSHVCAGVCVYAFLLEFMLTSWCSLRKHFTHVTADFGALSSSNTLMLCRAFPRNYKQKTSTGSLIVYMLRKSTSYSHIQIRQKYTITKKTHRGLQQQIKFNSVFPMLLLNLGVSRLSKL